MFIETSSPRGQGDNAKLSRMVTLTGKSCLKFYYHMYGAAMGTLKVKLCDAVIFEKSGNQGNQWKMEDIRLQGSGTKKVSHWPWMNYNREHVYSTQKVLSK